MNIDALSDETRQAAFEAMVAMAWADAHLTREEIFAVRAAGQLLSLSSDALDALDAGPPDLSGLPIEDLKWADRRLVYLCAAWMAVVDGREDDVEGALLAELRERLDVPLEEATTLREDARMMHVTAPSSMPWYEELAAVISAAASRRP